MLVLVVVDGMVSSSTIRDFHKNSFWQHHCDGTRKLYTNSGVHTVRSKEFEMVIAQTNSNPGAQGGRGTRQGLRPSCVPSRRRRPLRSRSALGFFLAEGRILCGGVGARPPAAARYSPLRPFGRGQVCSLQPRPYRSVAV